MIQKKFLISISLLCLLSSCRYEEGPFINFTPVKDRIRGQWKVIAIEKNGTSTTTEYPSIAEAHNNFFSFYASEMLSISYIDDNIWCEINGTYEFSSDKKKIIAAFSDKTNSYKRNYEIIKFKNKELKVKFTDEKNNKWVLEFSQIYSFLSYGM